MEVLTTSVCRSCRQRLTIMPRHQTFSTSSRRHAIPPESPAYIDIPSSLQPELQPIQRRKGILPVPRELFPSNRPDKPSQQYLDNVTRDPLPQNIKPESQLSTQQAHRLRAAEIRKRHLREGLTELYKRKQDTTQRLTLRSQKRQSERARLLSQPDLDSTRLTSISTPSSILTTKSSTPIADDLTIARALHAQKQANHARVSNSQKLSRLDALHTLYMNARSFITTEAQLDAAIEKQFDPEMFTADVRRGASIWNFGPPDTIKDKIAANQISPMSMADAARIFNKSGSNANVNLFKKEQERMKRIAEKLSGGKL